MLVVNAVEHHQGLQLDRQPDRRPRRRRRGQHQLAVRADGDSGAGGARRAAEADRRQSRRHQVLLVHDRRSGVGRGHDFPHGLHRGRRVRGVRAAGAGRARVGRDPGCRPRRRAGARRPRRARHAAARGGDAPVRQRHGRHDDGARSGSRVDCRLEEGRRSPARTCCAGRRPRACRASWSGFEVLDRGIARQGHEVFVDGERPAWSRAGRRRRS